MKKGIIVRGLDKPIASFETERGIKSMQIIFSQYDTDVEVVDFSYFEAGFSEEKYKNLVWKIKDINRNCYVDTQDYTGGKNAELKIFKQHAGPIRSDLKYGSPRGDEQDKLTQNSKPQRYLIEVYKDIKLNVRLDTVELKVFSDVYMDGSIGWHDSLREKTNTVNMNNIVFIYVEEIIGLFGQDVIIRIFNTKDSVNPVKEIIHKVEVPEISIPVEVKSASGLFFISDKYYFSIYHRCFESETLIFQSNHLLHVAKSLFNAKSQIEDTIEDLTNKTSSLAPVYIYSEEFFTQRYEPCRYTKIKAYFKDSRREFIVFDEENLTKGTKGHGLDFTLLDYKDDLSIKYEIEGLVTKQCRNDPAYQLTQTETSEKPHSEGVFYVENLKEEQINFTVEGDNALLVYPTYNYTKEGEVIKDFKALSLVDLLLFFLKYNPFAISKKLHVHSIGMRTCRYRKSVAVAVVPDINWVFHLFFFSPDENANKASGDSYLYYRNHAIDLESSWVNSFVNFDIMDDTVGRLLDKMGLNEEAITAITSSFRSIILEFIKNYIAGIMQSIKVGMHAYLHNGDKEEAKPTQIIDYGDRFEYVRFMAILQVTLLNIAIDLLILWFTRGKNLPLILQRAKQAINISKMIAPSKITSREDNFEFILPQVGMFMGGGYRYAEDGTAVNVIEFNLAAEPLFGVQYKVENTAGDLLSSMIGMDKMFTTTRKNVGLVGTLIKSKKLVKGAISKEKPPTSVKESINKEKESLKKNPLKYFTARDVIDGLFTLEEHLVEKFDEAIKRHLGVETKITFIVEGYYDAKINLQFNLDKQVITVVDATDNTEELREVTYGHRAGVKLIFKVDGLVDKEVKYSKLNEYIPDFLQQATGREFVDVQTKAEIEGEIEGGMFFERTYKYSTTDFLIKAALGNKALAFKEFSSPSSNQPVYVDRVVFSGLIGSVKMNVKIKREDQSDFLDIDISKKGINGESIPVHFEIFPPYTLEGDDTPVFVSQLEK